MSLLTKIYTAFLISALSLTVKAAEPEVQNPDQQPSENALDVTDTREVIQVLYVGNASDIKIADLVRERNPDESLQSLADELTRGHGWMNRILKTMAKIKSISLETDEMSETAQLVNNQMAEGFQMLASKPVDEFRSAFLEAIILEHQKSLKLYNQIEQGTKDDALKVVIAIFRQIEEKHLSDAQKLQLSSQTEQPAAAEQAFQ